MRAKEGDVRPKEGDVRPKEDGVRAKRGDVRAKESGVRIDVVFIFVDFRNLPTLASRYSAQSLTDNSYTLTESWRFQSSPSAKRPLFNL